MIKLTRKENEERDAFVLELQDAYSTLQTEIENYNGDVSKEFEKLKEQIQDFNQTVCARREALDAEVERYNEKLTSVKEFANSLGNKFDEEYKEKSETWRDSPRGEQVGEFVDIWKDFEVELFEPETFESIDTEPPSDVEVPDDVSEALSNLKAEP
jgi:predicted  nucleic acid-binding Zn-ribbon protein